MVALFQFLPFLDHCQKHITSMDKTEVRSIIEATLRNGTRTPGLFDLPKILGIKSKLESSTSISEIILILEKNRTLLSTSFGLDDSVFDEVAKKLKALP